MLLEGVGARLTEIRVVLSINFIVVFMLKNSSYW